MEQPYPVLLESQSRSILSNISEWKFVNAVYSLDQNGIQCEFDKDKQCCRNRLVLILDKEYNRSSLNANDSQFISESLRADSAWQSNLHLDHVFHLFAYVFNETTFAYLKRELLKTSYNLWYWWLLRTYHWWLFRSYLWEQSRIPPMWNTVWFTDEIL